MTLQEGLKKTIIKKTVYLICIAVVLACFCIFTSSHKGLPNYNHAHLIYNIISIALSLAIITFIAWKMNYFHHLFAKEWSGTVIKAEFSDFNTEIQDSIRSINSFVIVIRVDGSDEIKKLRFSSLKISPSVYDVGDKIQMLKGTVYPINLTREAEQHICPLCGFNSCYDDECPNCKIKY